MTQAKVDGPATAPSRALILGGSGMLGRAWRELLDRWNIHFEAPSHKQLDLLSAEAIARVIQPHHAMVINCAAWTDVDGAENHEAQATALNGLAVATLAERCRETGATLIHYSTDYVFGGDATSPYPIDAPRAPLGAYGRSKLAGEQALEASGASYLLIRTSWLYAPWGRNFVRTIAGAAKSKPEFKIVSDQRGRPTSSEHLAASTLALCEAGARGTYHITDGGECTWYEFGCAIAAAVAPQCIVHPCSTAEFPRPARRPAYSVLDLSTAEAALGPMPSWQDNLANVLSRLEPLA